MALVTLAVRPGTEISTHDFATPDGARHAGVAVDGAHIHLMSNWGPSSDVDIITAGLILATAAMELVEAARERMRLAAGLPALPDGLAPASMADALAGWTQGELAEAFGS